MVLTIDLQDGKNKMVPWNSKLGDRKQPETLKNVLCEWAEESMGEGWGDHLAEEGQWGGEDSIILTCRIENIVYALI